MKRLVVAVAVSFFGVSFGMQPASRRALSALSKADTAAINAWVAKDFGRTDKATPQALAPRKETVVMQEQPKPVHVAPKANRKSAAVPEISKEPFQRQKQQKSRKQTFNWFAGDDKEDFWLGVASLASAGLAAQYYYKKHMQNQIDQAATAAERAALEKKIAAESEAIKNIVEGVNAGDDYAFMIEKGTDPISFPVKVILSAGSSVTPEAIRYQLNYLKRRMYVLNRERNLLASRRILVAMSQLTRFLQGEPMEAIESEPDKIVGLAESLEDDIGNKANPLQYKAERGIVAYGLERPQRVWYGTQEAYMRALHDWEVVYKGRWARYFAQMENKERLAYELVDNNAIEALSGSFIERELLHSSTFDATKLARCLDLASPTLKWVLVRYIAQLTATPEGREALGKALIDNGTLGERVERALRESLQDYDIFLTAHPTAPRSESFERVRVFTRGLAPEPGWYQRLATQIGSIPARFGWHAS